MYKGHTPKRANVFKKPHTISVFYRFCVSVEPSRNVSRETFSQETGSVNILSVVGDNMAQHNEIGALGEQIALQWITSNGYKLLEQNYREKWGEIDIIAQTKTGLHFIEVKTVSYETRLKLEKSVSRGTWRPEEMVHDQKLQRLGRAIETWIAKNEYAGDWQLDVITVRMVPHEKYAKVKCIENVILE